MTVELGTTFDGRYRLEREIGAGGFARVFLATNSLTAAQVALKILTPGPNGSYDLDLKRRFLREGSIWARIDHPNTVRLLHVGEADGLLYLAAEYVRGQNLAEVLSERGRFRTEEAMHIARQLLYALDAAHRAGLVHRDLKPENVMVCPTAGDPLHVKLLDFGIARTTEGGVPALTATGELVGTPRYMAPEQLTERPADARSDIYALGLVMFELVLGRSALHGGSWADQLERLRSGHLIAATHLEQVEPQLLELLQRMTQRQPEQRFGSAVAVLRALDGERVDMSTRDRRSPWLVGVLLALVAVVAIGVWVSVDEPEPQRVVDRATKPRSADGIVRTDEAPPLPPIVGPEFVVQAVANAYRAAARAGTLPSSGCDVPAPSTGYRNGNPTVYFPRQYDHVRPLPLVVYFHADYEAPRDFFERGAWFDSAEEHGFMLLAPEDLKDSLLVGRYTRAWDEVATKLDRIRSVYAEAMSEFCLDRSRVFLLGHSDGAVPALALSCEPWVTAVAVNAYSYVPNGSSPFMPADWCEARKPLLWMHPLHSPHIPRDGQTNCSGTHRVSPARVADLWKGRNRCRGAAREWFRRGDSECETWACAAPFVYCDLDGGSVWPGGTVHWTEKPACRDDTAPDFPINDQVWRFFSDAPPLTEVPELDEL